jgi:ribose transport system ATP-binding protein
MNSNSAVIVQNLSKTFPGQRALNNFNLDLRKGEIHALVGENGSGKSTLIKCLSGYHEPDEGAEIFVDGLSVPVPYGPTAARKFGLAFIHQDLGLVPSLSILENLALSRGYFRNRFGAVDWKRETKNARKILAEFGHAELDPRQLVQELPLATQTIVAVARAMSQGGKAHVVVLDEPTASMPHNEVEHLFAAIRKIAATGVSILYVSHRLDEIFQLCDRVTAIRNGDTVGTFNVADLDYDGLVELIVGDTVIPFQGARDETITDEVLLKFDGLSGGVVDTVSGLVRAGEVVGVTGLLGSGSSDLGKILFGALDRTSGQIEIAGKVVDSPSPGDLMERGVSFVPGDRPKEGVFPWSSLDDNVMLTDTNRFSKRWRRRSLESTFVTQLLGKFNVRPLDSSREIYTLSGGNQQKVVLAKWLNLGPRVVILEEPVQGIDIGAKTEVYSIIGKLADEGKGVLVISTEIEDLTRLCHRVLVMKNGKIIAEISGSDRTRERIASLT